MTKYYHLSPKKNLDILIPSHPAEDVIKGVVKWDEQEQKLFVPCVSFGTSVKGILKDVPCAKGYIYEPVKPLIHIREFFLEARGQHELSQLSQEVRVYYPVKVKRIGEFKLIGDGENGIEYNVKYYK